MKQIKELPWLYGLVIFVLMTIEIFLLTTNAKPWLMIYIAVMPLAAIFMGHAITRSKQKRYFNEIETMVSNLKQKYLISEMMEEPEDTLNKAWFDLICDICKSDADDLKEAEVAVQDYKEYIEMWIHEIKIPIASCKMIIENNPTPASRSLNEELDKIDAFTEQALYYAKSNMVQKDYRIKKVNLNGLVKEAIKKNKSLLISKGIKLSMGMLDLEVQTDEKWVVFILSQLISNSCKYGSGIHFEAILDKEQVVLKVIDQGMGIPPQDLDRIFEKGFVGENGRRMNQKSTGIGLYLCAKLCSSLHIGISCHSVVGEGTTMSLIFPKGSFTLQ